MLSQDGCRARRARLLHRVNDIPTLILVHHPLHVYYLTGYLPAPSRLNGEAPNWLVIHPGGESMLVTDTKQFPEAETAFVDLVDAVPWYGLDSPVRWRPQAVHARLVERLKARRIVAGRLACEMDRLPLQVLLGLEEAGLPRPSLDITPHFEAMRQVKDHDEMQILAQCVAIVEAMHAASRDLLEPGMTELELYNKLNVVAAEAAGAPILMRGIVEASPRLNGEARLQKTIENGDLVILDLFPVHHGYRADFTNTLRVGGRPAARQRELFGLCRAAMAAGEAALRPGAIARDAHAAVRGVFEDAGVAGLFPHHAGHGIGLEHPERPYLVPASEETLVEGAVVALEPGLYDPRAGRMRIEHNYLITAGGFRRLSNHRIDLE